MDTVWTFALPVMIHFSPSMTRKRNPIDEISLLTAADEDLRSGL
jgi:hypothetical protein